MHTFSISETVKFASGVVQKNLGFFILFSVLFLGVQLAARVVGESESSLGTNAVSGLDTIVSLLLLVLLIFFSIWFVRVGIDAVDAKKLSFSTIVPSWEVVWKYILSNIVVALILAIPSLILVGVLIAFGIASAFGGIMTAVTFGVTSVFLLGILLVLVLLFVLYLSSRLVFTTYFVVDQKLGPIESVQASWRITQGKVWKLIGLMFVLALINLAGTLALLVGLLITIPITFVAWAYAYRSLAGRHDSVPTPGGDLVEPVPTPTIGQ